MIDDAMTNLANSVGKSATFRAWVGATGGTELENQAAAEARCYKTTVTSETRPFALMTAGPGFSAVRHAGGARDHYAKTGQLTLWLEDLQANVSGDTDSEKMDSFLATVMDILDEILALSGTGGYLSIAEITDAHPPAFGGEDDAEPVILASYTITWGPGP